MVAINFVISGTDGQYYANQIMGDNIYKNVKQGKISHGLMKIIEDFNPKIINIESPKNNILKYLHNLQCDSITITDPQLLIPVSRANVLTIYVFGKTDLLEEYLLQFTRGNINKLTLYVCRIDKKIFDEIHRILDHYLNIVSAKKDAFDTMNIYFNRYVKQENLPSTFGIEVDNDNLLLGFSNDYTVLYV